MLGAVGSAPADSLGPEILVKTTNLSSTASLAQVSLSNDDFGGYDFAVDYAPGSSEWCSDGRGPYSETPPQPFDTPPGGSRTTTVRLSGLSPGREYCTAGVVYYNGRVFDNFGGEWHQGQRPWFFNAGAPNVEPSYVIPSSRTGDRLTATIDPLGSATTYAFQWGLAARTDEHGTPRERWCDSGGTQGRPLGGSPSMSLGSETAPQKVSYRLKNLVTGRQYCWMIHAVNATAAAVDFPGGTCSFPGAGDSNCSPDFPRGSYSNYFVASDPTISTGPATQIAAGSAVLHLTVADLDFSVVDWTINLAPSQSPLCRSARTLYRHGRWIDDTTGLPPVGLQPAWLARVRVRQRVDGLRAHTRYCYVAWLDVQPDTSIYQLVHVLGRVRYFTTR